MSAPECPHCACQRSTIIRRYEWWGTVAEQRRCGLCGRTYSHRPVAVNPAAPVDSVVIVGGDGATADAAAGCAAGGGDNGRPAGGPIPYPRLHCPACGGRRTRVTSTRPHGVRWHRCRECGHPFQSYEEG